MLRDCLEIFKQERKRVEEEGKDPERLILDSYIPEDGDYIIVRRGGTYSTQTVKKNKKTGKLENPFTPQYREICFYDYHSRLVSMDKPQDPKKTIHSNNYLSFWIKWDSLSNGKLDEEAIDRYFDVLASPREKYKKPQDRKMYDYIASEVGEVDQEELEKNRRWIKENIFQFKNAELDFGRKNYLKIFFEADADIYLREEKRYLITKIFNKNDYNVEIDGTILGLPNDNLGLNSKKPYMENKTQKVTVPYLISAEDALLQRQFFDYLMNKANAGETDIFLDVNRGRIIAKKGGEMVENSFSGYYLKIRKGKELTILHQDVIVGYHYQLNKIFLYQNIAEDDDQEDLYREYRNKKGLQEIINKILFSNWLTGNYFTPEDELSVSGKLKQNLVWAREPIFAWLYKGRKDNIENVLCRSCQSLLLDSIYNGFIRKAMKQFNLLCSLRIYFAEEGECDMANKYNMIEDDLRKKINDKSMQKMEVESDEEYFYAVGQVTYYFVSLSETKEKTHFLANPFFNVKNDVVLKEKLRQFFKKYNYKINFGKGRFEKMLGLISGYEPDGPVLQDAIIAGYLRKNLIYEKTEKKEQIKEEA